MVNVKSRKRHSNREKKPFQPKSLHYSGRSHENKDPIFRHLGSDTLCTSKQSSYIEVSGTNYNII